MQKNLNQKLKLHIGKLCQMDFLIWWYINQIFVKTDYRWT